MVKRQKPKLKLTGEDGHPQFVLGMARQVAIQAGWTQMKWNKVSKEARAIDYNHMIRVMMKYFDVQ